MKIVDENSYNSIDNFRIMAALMVIAIHVFPFSSYGNTLDNLITLTLFRLAIPFFFMISGYFLIGPYSEKETYINDLRINKSIIKMLKLYFISIIVYLPLSILNKTITLDISFLQVIKLLIFDGSFYHLWYFPASILGLYLVKYSIKYFGIKLSLLLSLILYIIGLLGDSYYNLINISFIKDILNTIFKFSSYTRNGIFFTPIFLVLGASIYRNRGNKKYNKKINIIGLIISIFILLIEGYYINIVNIPRHNSMYISLLPTIYFLFNLLINRDSSLKISNVKRITLLVYVIHPLVIYSLYLFGKFIRPIRNSLLNFLLISIFSFTISYFIIKIKIPKKEKNKIDDFRTRKYISNEKLLHNLSEVKTILQKETDIMAVVKSNAYGHNANYCSKILEANGVKYFAVATLTEAIELRKSGIKGDILIFAYTPLDRIDEVIYYDLLITVIDYEYAKKLNKLNKKTRVHLKIDTGMHRLGISCYETEKIIDIYKMVNIDVEGIYSHLASSDSLDSISKERSKEQIDKFDSLLCILKSKKIKVGLTHIQSSYGLLNYSYLKYDLARVGIILYGVLSNPNDNVLIKLNLKPVLKLTGRLIQIQEVGLYEYIGYGLSFKTIKPSRIGIVSIGYADGVPRELSDKNFLASYDSQAFPIIGRICMDMLLVDISDIKDIKLDDEIIIINNPEDIVKKNNTLTNEVLSRLGNRSVEKYIK